MHFITSLQLKTALKSGQAGKATTGIKSSTGVQSSTSMQLLEAIQKAGLSGLLVSLACLLSPPVFSATKLIGMSGRDSAQIAQPIAVPRLIYTGRVTPPKPAPAPRFRQVINESAGYHRYRSYRYDQWPYAQTYRPYDQAYRPRPGISAQLYYQAPSTTVINRRVEVIAPQNASSEVYVNQATDYLYPSSAVRYYPARRYYPAHYPPAPRITMNPQDTENRAKQWTDKADFGQ